jgi:hypothetical protein
MRKYSLIYIAISVLLLASSVLKAQRLAQDYWHEGKIVLEDDTIGGNLKFNLENELIQIDKNGVLQTLTARKVLAFQFFDRYEQRERSYYALPYAKVSNYKTPTFFELLYQGESVTLLCREAWATQTTTLNNNPYSPNMPINIQYVKASFYLLYKNSKIRLFDGTKKGLLILLEDREADIKNYLKANRVRLDSKEDMTNLIDYYNTRKKKAGQ